MSTLAASPLGGSAQRCELYRLLSDPTRLKLLALCSLQELAVGELAELVRARDSAISRQCAALRDAGLLDGRKQGTWLLLKLSPTLADDAVVADAVGVGIELCTASGTLERIDKVLAARDAETRAFFARGGTLPQKGLPEELIAYVHLLAPLIGRRRLAIDAGTGDGALLEVLAPLFDTVIALDRSNAQLELARQRAEQRQFGNLLFVCGELDGEEIQEALATAEAASHGHTPKHRCRGADAVFASRILHHAAVPARAVAALSALARPPGKDMGGAVLIMDYETHRDEAMRKQQADLWLGFDPKDLLRMAKDAGLGHVEHGQIPKPWRGDGPDSHVVWQWLAGRRI